MVLLPMHTVRGTIFGKRRPSGWVGGRSEIVAFDAGANSKDFFADCTSAIPTFSISSSTSIFLRVSRGK